MKGPDHERRRFLGAAASILGAIPILGALFVSLRAGLAPARTERPARFPLCRPEDVPEDGILERAVSFRMRRGPAVESVARVVFVTRDETGEVIALSGECTHLTCPVQLRDVHKTDDPDEPPLQCPCHGGKFSRLGEVLDGPPPRPLRRLRLQLPEGDDPLIYLLEV